MGYDRYRSRRRYRWSYDDDDDDEDSDDSEAEMGEVYEEELSLDHWLDPHGRKQPFGEMHLEKSEILSQEDEEDWSVRQEIHEATGNEGVSMERWYRQGVIVIWPRDRYFGILAGEGQASAIPALEQMAARSKKPAALAACRTFAEEIIGHWKPRQRSAGGDSSWSARMLKLLERDRHRGTRSAIPPRRSPEGLRRLRRQSPPSAVSALRLGTLRGRNP